MINKEESEDMHDDTKKQKKSVGGEARDDGWRN